MHSLQHTLTDATRRLSVLQVDISNAFNACDRGRMLRELYSTPQLQPLYRMVDFAYSTPSVLLLERGGGNAIRSENGVRQGDPLSALLFCVYMREVLNEVSERANVQLYGFFDDLNVVGTPGEVLKAFDALRTDLLLAVSLTCNTTKSHFAYFHDDTAPLMRSQRQALAEHDVQFHDSWVQVLGAVVGKDGAAVADGIACTTGDDGGGGSFFPSHSVGRTPLQLSYAVVASLWSTSNELLAAMHTSFVYRRAGEYVRYTTDQCSYCQDE